MLKVTFFVGTPYFWARGSILEQQQMKASQKVEAFLLPVLSSALILLYYYTTSRPKCFYVRTIRTYVQYTAFTDINPTFRIYRFIPFHATNKYTYIYMNTYFVVRCVHVGLANALKFYLKRYGWWICHPVH